ncbi:RidA family protein [Candidatus Lokiarchaeum ossiferum]|uniref:RidA family protein n=1 Tax=Candidatus Lokiarchaeum ossiferum TaxID=2951803 RepID=UPI00352C9313
MGDIIRKDVNSEYAYSGAVKAGDYIFLTFCVGNVGGTIKEQVEGALGDMERRLTLFDLTLSAVVQVNVLLRDPWDIPIMEAVFKEKFKGIYPSRKTLSTEFAHKGGPEGLKCQIDGIAYYPK